MAWAPSLALLAQLLLDLVRAPSVEIRVMQQGQQQYWQAKVASKGKGLAGQQQQ